MRLKRLRLPPKPSCPPPLPPQVQAQYEAALAQDANVFDYDGVYDAMQQQRVVPQQQEKIERRSRYIAQVRGGEGRSAGCVTKGPMKRTRVSCDTRGGVRWGD